MTKQLRHVAPWALVFVLSLFSKSVYDARRRAEGREQIERAARVAAEVDLKNARTRVDTVYAADTIAFWQNVRRFQAQIAALRGRVSHLADSAAQLHPDTVTLTERESVLVFAADSVVQQCKNIISLCEERVAVRDSLLAIVTADRDYFKKKAQPPLQLLPKLGFGLTVGVDASGQPRAVVGLTLGWRLP